MNPIRTIALPTLAASAVSLVTGCLSVTGFDHPAPPGAVENTLGVAVLAQAAEGTESAFVRDISAAATQNLSSRGFRLVVSETPDVEVSLGVSQKEFNRAGDFIVYDGRVNARVAIPGDARIVDETAFSARGARALGEAAATAALSSALTPQLDGWLAKTVTVDNLGIGVVTVAVEYHYVSLSRKPALVEQFVSSVKGIDGVHDCRLVGETWFPRWWWRDDYTAAYRIVYDLGSFPNGPLNTISLRQPDLNLAVLPTAAPAAP